MDVQPPLLALIEQEDEGELSLEDQFAQILHALMKDDISAATAIQAFENASVAMMQQYRWAPRRDGAGLVGTQGHGKRSPTCVCGQ